MATVIITVFLLVTTVVLGDPHGHPHLSTQPALRQGGHQSFTSGKSRFPSARLPSCVGLSRD